MENLRPFQDSKVLKWDCRRAPVPSGPAWAGGRRTTAPLVRKWWGMSGSLSGRPAAPSPCSPTFVPLQMSWRQRAGLIPIGPGSELASGRSGKIQRIRFISQFLNSHLQVNLCNFAANCFFTQQQFQTWTPEVLNQTSIRRCFFHSLTICSSTGIYIRTHAT
jgi:hypothetical protein